MFTSYIGIYPGVVLISFFNGGEYVNGRLSFCQLLLSFYPNVPFNLLSLDKDEMSFKLAINWTCGPSIYVNSLVNIIPSNFISSLGIQIIYGLDQYYTPSVFVIVDLGVENYVKLIIILCLLMQTLAFNFLRIRMCENI